VFCKDIESMLKYKAIFIAIGLWLVLAIASLPLFGQSGVPLQPPPSQSTAPQADPKGKPPADPATAPPADAPAKSGKSKGGNNKNPAAGPGKDSTATHATYVIGPEDQLFIRVWQQAELSGSVTVGPDGTISLQLTGEIKAAGMTPRQLEQELARRLRTTYLKEISDTEVNVQVLRINSRTYLIQGEVGRPGIYPITRPMSIMEALVAGGGFGPFANRKKIYILRGNQKINFNWVDVSKGRHTEQNIEVQNGDQIFVP
jgi:polysaccharide export outer membrane protein